MQPNITTTNGAYEVEEIITADSNLLQLLEFGAKVTFEDGWWVSGDLFYPNIDFGNLSGRKGKYTLNQTGLISALTDVNSQRYDEWLDLVADEFGTDRRSMLKKFPNAPWREIYLTHPYQIEEAVFLVCPDFGTLGSKFGE